jgi:uroporphyrin-III C-methyltransferase
VCAAVEEEGSRPPGLLVIGNACGVLRQFNQKWVVEEGFKGLDDIAVVGDLPILGTEVSV